jgi:hypothetical protein
MILGSFSVLGGKTHEHCFFETKQRGRTHKKPQN